MELEESLQDYVMYQSRRSDIGEISPNSIPTFMMGIYKFLKVNRKKIDRDSIVQLYPKEVKLQGDKAITTEQIQALLNTTGEKREKAIVHVFSATGAKT